MKRVVIIGAGLGGLATALRLSHLDFRVTILEKLAKPGGRSNLIEQNGFRVDTGPTILVMKFVFEELYRAIDEDFNKRLELGQLDPNYRIYFHDGTSLDLYSNMSRLAAEVEKIEPGAAERLFRFLGASARKYQLGMSFVERNYKHITDLINPQAAIRLLQTGAYRNLYGQVESFFNHNDKLTKAFSFHSMFLGLSPFEALAMYSLITYADLVYGMWFIKGGIYSIVEDMVKLLSETNAEIYTSTPVKKIIIENGQVRGVKTETGELFPADVVVSNADLPYTYRELIPVEHQSIQKNRRLQRKNYACSGYLLYLGVNKTYNHLQHQALYFSKDYRSNLDEIFNQQILPRDPSFHLNIPSITDPNLAPPGNSLIYVLAPVPNLQARIDWNDAAYIMRKKIIERLENLIDPEITQHITWKKEYLPTDFQQDFNAEFGTAFGSLSHRFLQSAYFRPHNKDDKIGGLYFVGQATYPGIGMPMVVISARLVSERIAAEWKNQTIQKN